MTKPPMYSVPPRLPDEYSSNSRLIQRYGSPHIYEILHRLYGERRITEHVNKSFNSISHNTSNDTLVLNKRGYLHVSTPCGRNVRTAYSDMFCLTSPTHYELVLAEAENAAKILNYRLRCSYDAEIRVLYDNGQYADNHDIDIVIPGTWNTDRTWNMSLEWRRNKIEGLLWIDYLEPVGSLLATGEVVKDVTCPDGIVSAGGKV